MAPLHVVILAAGQGTRMKSDLPKVLHRLAGRALLERVVDAAQSLHPQAVHVVYGHGGDAVMTQLRALDVRWVEQAEQLGTGHAVSRAMPGIPDGAIVLVLYGDVPLVNPETLRETVETAASGTLALITATVDDPSGYGRILRGSDDGVIGIVEEKDAAAEQKTIDEINTGILAAGAGSIRGWLDGLSDANAQGEYYLTDVIAAAVADGVEVRAVAPDALEEVLGVNDRVQLAALERFHQGRVAARLMRDGATVADPARLDVRGSLTTGRDVFIDVNVVFEGEVTLGDRVRVGPGCVIRDTEIGDDTEIRPHCVIEQARVGARCQIGPFARLRPDAWLEDEVHVGNYVEVKNAVIARGSKANHLTYIGDADIGAGVNIGAGTITCNYDGANKHRTVIGDGVFVGSGVMLVAPVTLEPGATIGAGSTIAKSAPADELTLTRSQQKTIRGWKRPVKKR